jgi:hypothetical protein
MAEVFSPRLPTAQGAGLKKFSGVWANSGNVNLFGLCSVIVVKDVFWRFCVGGCSVWQKIKINLANQLFMVWEGGNQIGG